MRMFHKEIRTARRKTLIQTAIHSYRIRRHGTLYLVLLGLAVGKLIDTLLLMENAICRFNGIRRNPHLLQNLVNDRIYLILRSVRMDI